jgi:PAS domain-containing protein
MGNGLNILLVSSQDRREAQLLALLKQVGMNARVEQRANWTIHQDLNDFDILLYDQDDNIPRASDTSIPTLALGSTDFDEEHGSPETFVRFIRYAIERHQNTLHLQGKHLRFELAMRGSNDGLWDWDLIKNRVFWSERWATIMG